MKLSSLAKNIFAVGIVFILLGTGLKWLTGNSAGPPDGATRAPGDTYGSSGCAAGGCHSAPSVNSDPSSDISLTGISGQYIPGQTYTLTFAISNDAAGNNGFEVTSQRSDTNTSTGTLSSAGSGSTISGNYWKHSGSQTNTSWTVNWTAPNINAGNIRFYGASNKGGAASGGNLHFNQFNFPVAPPPSNTQFIGVIVDSVSASWDLTNGNSYVMALSAASDFSSITASGTGNLNQNTTSYSGLSSNTTYYFKVKISTHPDALYSTAISTLTLARSPAVVSFQVFNTSISVTLNPSGNQSGTTLSLTTGNFETSASSSGVSGAGNTTLFISNLTANATYMIQSRAVGFTTVASSANTVASTATFANVPGAGSFTIAPAQVNVSSITYSWDSNGNSLSPRTSYQVQISTDSNFSVYTDSITFNIFVTTIGLTTNTSYYFKASAFHRTGNGSQTTFNTAIVTSTLADPPAFAAFVSSEVALSSMTIRWDPKTNPSTVRYKIEISSISDFSKLSSSETFTLSVTTLTLSVNTTYYIRGTAFNNSQIGSVFTNQLTTATLANIPATETSTFTFVSISQITAQWNANGNPAQTAYIAQISTVSDFNSGILTSSTTFNVTVTTSGLSADSTYYFRVKAKNFSGIDTNFVSIGSTKTLAPGDTTPPANISGLTALTGDSDGQVKLAWTSVGDNGISGALNNAQYRIHASTANFFFFSSTLSAAAFGGFDFDTTITTTGVSPGTEVGTAVNGLYPGTTWYLAVITRDASDNWSFWNKAGSFNQLSSAPAQDMILPRPSSIFAGSNSSYSLTLQWTNPSAPSTYDDRDKYRLYSATASFSSITNSWVLLSSEVAHPLSQATTSQLAPNTTYFFSVSSLDLGDKGDGRYSVVFESASFPVVSTPTLTAVPGSATFTQVNISSLTATWGNGGNPSGTLYIAELSTSSNFTGSVSSSQTYVLSMTSTTLSGEITYYLRVKARNHQGLDSGYNSSISATTISGKPPAPSGLTVTVISPSSVTFSWTDNSFNEDGFRILNSTNGIYGSVGSNVTTLEVLGFSPNQLISARVAAFNSAGASTGTTSISSYTLANPPGTPSFLSVTNSSVLISWSTNSNPSTVPYEISQSTDDFVFSAGISTPVAFSANLTSTSTTISSLTPGGTYYFRIRARNSDAIATAFTASISTVTPPLQTILSTGGVINAGVTTVTADAGVTITITPLANGTTQQTFVSTKTAVVTYGNGFSLQLPAGISAQVVASANGLTLTSSQTVPITQSGITVEASSGTVSIQTSATLFTISLASTAVQNVQTTISSSTVQTVAISLNPPSGEIKLELPPASLSETAKVRFKLPDSLPSESSAITSLKALGIGAEILLNKAIQPARTVPITLTFRDSDLGSSNVNSLTCSRFDEATQSWTLVPSTVDSSSKKVIGRTRHFSKFQIMSVQPAANLTNAKVFPNPFRPTKGHTQIKFANLSTDTTIKIYTILGQLVKQLQADSTGRAFWDGKNEAGQDAASDVYLALLQNGAGKKILKVGIER